MISRRISMMILFIISCSIYTIAQTDYYYYKGTKIPLTLNENKVCVSTYKDNKDVREKILANVQVLETISDETFKVFDIIVIPKSDFEKLTSQDFWEEDAKSVILTSCYLTENNEDLYSTPFLAVRLKKEKDVDLLASYAEKYKLKIVGNNQFMPSWYYLSVTLESEKSPLECANELYETGKFASSFPEMAAKIGYSDQATIRGITTAKSDASSEIHDLQGRRLTAAPQNGVYIQNGKKKLVK